jgi:hypothetical protein
MTTSKIHLILGSYARTAPLKSIDERFPKP